MSKRPEWCGRFLQAVREGVGPCVAAELAGRHKTTPYSYADDHPDFREEWDAAERHARERRERRFQGRLRALTGGGDSSAQPAQLRAP